VIFDIMWIVNMIVDICICVQMLIDVPMNFTPGQVVEVKSDSA
jgi:hypothetical protein